MFIIAKYKIILYTKNHIQKNSTHAYTCVPFICMSYVPERTDPEPVYICLPDCKCKPF